MTIYRCRECKGLLMPGAPGNLRCPVCKREVPHPESALPATPKARPEDAHQPDTPEFPYEPGVD